MKKLRKQVFLKYMISNLLSSTISASFLNSLNVLTVRMQNIEYQHNKSIRRAIKDMIINDKFIVSASEDNSIRLWSF